ncbi:hypothetical protein P879_08890 [Paragonimus westermani]|uniref:N-terminal acetyltransferase B complex subunit NAA25 homolog n=1 Tax=Paragonimus westermani TaxID=34504 RepID=A0A8T0D033_9TREM|nr:hypothetical protein P879_08890 [Paragonimus westermani]
MLGLDLPHGRLKSVVDPLERGNFKKALTEINKVLKKTPTYAAARVLKALVLLKSGRPSEAADLAEDVIRACPTDETTLSTILCYFRETGQSAREREYLKSALEKCPNREDLLICLFLNQVQAEDFSAQQKTARLLSQQFSSRMYIYWMIVSTLMQADDNPDLGTRMFLPLAEKMLLREAIANKMEKHMEFQLLLDVLDRLGKHKDALDFLDRKELIDRLDESDYRCDYSDKRLKLCASLGLWERAFKLAESKLLQSPNHWNAWKCLLDMTVGCDSHELPSSCLTQLYSLIIDSIRDHPKVRGPQLARLDLLASLTKRGQRLPSDANIAQCLSLYLHTFSSKPVCAFDVAYLIPACLPDAVERTDFLKAVVDEVEKMDITFPADSKQTYRHLCVYQVARASGHNIPLGELIRTYLAYAPERKSIANLTQKLGDDHANPGAVDLCPADGFLLLALSSLAEQTHTVCSSNDSFGSTLLAAYWTQYLGISHASNNHHFRLRLCSLFSPHCLACPDLALSQTNRLQIKQLLYVSLGYFLVSPAPMLTLWAGSTPSGPLPDSNPVLGLYQRLHVLSGSTVSEAEEGILAAYRRSAYTRVREFTQFAKRLRHADVFLTARLELVYWQVAVMPDDFDSVLECLSDAAKELDLVDKRLENVADCRDFSVSTPFDPSTSENLTQEDSFAHIVQWIRLRRITVSAIRYCAEIVMGAVKLGDRLENATQVEDTCSVPDERSSRASEQISLMAEELRKMRSFASSSAELESFDVAKLAQSLLLPPNRVFSTPVQLPPTRMASLYLRGPFGAVLSAGISLVHGLHRLLSGGLEDFSEDQERAALNVLSNPYAFTSFEVSLGDSQHVERNTRNLEDIPIPTKSEENAAPDCPPTEITCHPAGILLLLGSLYEVLSLSCLFVSMVRCILCPRSHSHLSTGKRQRRKALKAPKSENTSVNVHSERAPALILKRLDSVGSRLLTTVVELNLTTSRLTKLVDSWMHWAKNSARTDCARLASYACCRVLTADFLTQFPEVQPVTTASLFAEIASSYEKSYTRLATGLRMKAISLDRMQNELQPYDSRTKKC